MTTTRVRVDAVAEVILDGLLRQMPAVTPKDLQLILGRVVSLHTERFRAAAAVAREERVRAAVQRMTEKLAAATQPAEPPAPRRSSGRAARFPALRDDLQALLAQQPSISCAAAHRHFTAQHGGDFLSYPHFLTYYWAPAQADATQDQRSRDSSSHVTPPSPGKGFT